MKMRPSGAALEDSTFCDILHKAVLQVCRDKYWADSPDWEVDGVICISVPHSQQQHVVKIHQKFPVNSVKHLDDRCYECHKRQKETVPVEEPTKESYAESVEDDASYRNVSVIDLEHATSTIMDPAQTCGQGTISSRTEQSPVRDQTQNSNFFASADLRGFSPNIHRRRSEHVKNFSDHIPAHVPAPSDSRHSNQEHSSITSHPGETTPPRKKPKITPDEFVVVKAEPDDDEDFALHMECIDEKESDILEVKDEALQPRDLAAETQDDINYLLHDTSDSSHQYNPADRSSWPQRHPTSTVTSQMDTSLTGQGAQGFSNILSTHGVDVEDGTMRLTTRVQHPSLIAGQSDSNAQDQRTMTRPSGQDSTAAANTIDVDLSFTDESIDESVALRFPSAPGYFVPRKRRRGKSMLQSPHTHVCSHCGDQFKYKQSLKRHEEGFHGNNFPFKCDQCFKGFHKKRRFEEHVKKHLGQIAEQCEKCCTSFSSMDAKRRHVKSCVGLKYPLASCVGPYLDLKRSLEAQKYMHGNIL